MACCSARSIRLKKINTRRATAKALKGQAPKGKKPTGKKSTPTKTAPCKPCGKPKPPKNVQVPNLPPIRQPKAKPLKNWLGK